MSASAAAPPAQDTRGATVGDGVRTALHRSSGTPAHMSQTQILVLGAIAGLTIFIGLPVGRVGRLPIAASTFLAATATGILLFLLWDVLAAGVEPVESALTAAAVDHTGGWGRFAWLAVLLGGGFVVGLMSLVYFDELIARRRRTGGPVQRRRRRRGRGGGAARRAGEHALACPVALADDRHRHRAAQLLRGPRDRAVGGVRGDQPGADARSSASACTTPPRASASSGRSRRATSGRRGASCCWSG